MSITEEQGREIQAKVANATHNGVLALVYYVGVPALVLGVGVGAFFAAYAILY